MEPSYTVGGNVNDTSTMETSIPLLGIYPEKNMVWKDKCTPMFTVALFTIAKTWKQPKCPSTDEWEKKLWYIYKWTYSVIKRNEMSFAATWMDLEIIILSEVRQRRGDNMLSLILEILKKWYKRTYLQNRNNSQT